MIDCIYWRRSASDRGGQQGLRGGHYSRVADWQSSALLMRDMWVRIPPCEPFEFDSRFEPCYTTSMTELRQKILELHNAGVSYNEISRELGCAKSTISYHVGQGQKAKTNLRGRNSKGKKRQYIAKIKSETPCADCKVNYPSHVMDFDHINGDKENTISVMVHNCSWEDLLQEIEKCEVVCANCHRQRTWYRQIKSGSQAHGYSQRVAIAQWANR